MLIMITSCGISEVSIFQPRATATPRPVAGEPNPEITGRLREGVDSGERGYPYVLDCNAIQPVPFGEGPTWEGITIGVTQFEQAEALFSDGTIWYSDPLRIILWGNKGLEICVSDHTIYLVTTGERSSEYPSSLQGWVDLYGAPSFITWSYYNEDRMVVWPEEGLMAEFQPNTDLRYARGSRMFLFPRMTSDEFELSGLYTALPDEEPPILGEMSELSSEELRVEDPFSELIEEYLRENR